MTKPTGLPPCVYHKHGAYYLVKRNRWMRLGKNFPEAMAEYGKKMGSPSGVGMDELIDETLTRAAERVKQTTLEQYNIVGRKIKTVFSEFAPDQVTASHIARYLDHLRTTPNMANRTRTVLKMAFDLAVLQGICLSNPVLSVPRYRETHRKRYLTDGEYHAIRQAASPVMRAIMDMCYLTAQRVDDVLRIRLSDISNSGVLFQPRKTTNKKGEGKKILISMSKEIQTTISKARKLHGDVTRIYLFGLKKGGKVRSYRGVRDQFYRATTKAGVEDAHLHDIRAKSLTDAKKQGLDPQLLALHTTESMTARYLRDRETQVVKGPSLRHQSNLLDKTNNNLLNEK